MKLLSFVAVFSLWALLSCGQSLEDELRNAGKAGDRTVAEKHYRTGYDFHTKAKDYPAAAQAYQEAFRSDPSWWKPLYQLGCVHSLMGKPQPALLYLKAAWKVEQSRQLLSYLKKDSDLAGIRNSKSFQEFLATIDQPKNSPVGFWWGANCKDDPPAGEKMGAAAYGYTFKQDGRISISIAAGPAIKGTYAATGSEIQIQLKSKTVIDPAAGPGGGEMEVPATGKIKAHFEIKSGFLCLSNVSGTGETFAVVPGCYCSS